MLFMFAESHLLLSLARENTTHIETILSPFPPPICINERYIYSNENKYNVDIN